MSYSPEIFAAITANDIPRIQSLLDSDPAAASQCNAEGISPLLFAVYRGKSDAVQALLTHHPPANIWEAAAVGSAKTIAAEIENDPDAVRRVSPDGWLPLHLACFFNHIEAAQVIMTHGAEIDAVAGGFRVTPLQSALANGNTAIARMLLEQGASVEASSNGSDWSPLHYCASHDLPEIATLLLERGANPNSQLSSGDTPLKMARSAGKTATMQVLLDHGAQEE